jgi:membrane fusion protein
MSQRVRRPHVSMPYMANGPLHLKLFRREALVRSRQHWLGELLVATPPRAPLAAALAILVCLLLAGSTVAISIPERIPASGVVMPSGRILKVLAPRAGTVSEVRVADGQRVEGGQTLLEIISGDSGADSPWVARRRSLEREFAALDEGARSDAAASLQSIAGIERRIALNVKRLDAAAVEARLHREQLAVATRHLERGQELLTAGSIAAHEVDTLATERLNRLVAQNAANDRRLALEEELALLANERDQRVSEAEQRRLRTEREHERLQRELLGLDAETRTAVVAPGPGSAGALLVGEGSSVRSGQLLLQVFEADSELLAYIYISADDSGRVSRGQAVDMRLHAYPYQLYGTLTATIVAVASVPVPAADLPFMSGVRGTVVEVRARLDAGALAAEWPRLGAGATFSADLVSARWPLYRWLLSGGRPAA